MLHLLHMLYLFFLTTALGNELNPFVELCCYDKVTNIFLIYLRRQEMYRSLEIVKYCRKAVLMCKGFSWYTYIFF